MVAESKLGPGSHGSRSAFLIRKLSKALDQLYQRYTSAVEETFRLRDTDGFISMISCVRLTFCLTLTSLRNQLTFKAYEGFVAIVAQDEWLMVGCYLIYATTPMSCLVETR